MVIKTHKCVPTRGIKARRKKVFKPKEIYPTIQLHHISNNLIRPKTVQVTHKQRMTGVFTHYYRMATARYLGLKRNAMRFDLICITYNMKHGLTLQRESML
jgi:hypothetical protein